jgi:hypothetical protein
LGKAGYEVIASSPVKAALGLRSNFACSALISPASDEEGGSRLRNWLAETIARDSIAAMVPSESVLLAIKPLYADFRHVLPFSSDASVVFAGMSKFDVSERLQRSLPGDAFVPQTVLIRRHENASSIDECLRKLRGPMFAKVDSIHGDAGLPSLVKRFNTQSEAFRGIEFLLGRYDRVLVQEYVPGVGVGVFLLRWNGRILARFMHRRLHEVPHTGGASSYRRAWWNDDLFADAVRRVAALHWQGVAMLEYRWDPESNRFWFIEMNGRFWGSIHLALYAGVDFPTLLLDAFFGSERECLSFDLSTRSRWTFPREVEYVWSRLKDEKLPLTSRGWSLLEFFLLCFDPHAKSDLNFPGDRVLYLLALRQSIARWTGREPR